MTDAERIEALEARVEQIEVVLGEMAITTEPAPLPLVELIVPSVVEHATSEEKRSCVVRAQDE